MMYTNDVYIYIYIYISADGSLDRRVRVPLRFSYLICRTHMLTISHPGSACQIPLRFSYLICHAHTLTISQSLTAISCIL